MYLFRSHAEGRKARRLTRTPPPASPRRGAGSPCPASGPRAAGPGAGRLGDLGGLLLRVSFTHWLNFIFTTKVLKRSSKVKVHELRK